MLHMSLAVVRAAMFIIFDDTQQPATSKEKWKLLMSETPPTTTNVIRGWSPLQTPISSHLPFSAAVEANGFVFVSGQASVDDQGVIVSGDFEQEMRRSMSNVQRILAAVGLDLGDVVRVTSYVTIPPICRSTTCCTGSTSRPHYRRERRLLVVSRLHSSSRST